MRFQDQISKTVSYPFTLLHFNVYFIHMIVLNKINQQLIPGMQPAIRRSFFFFRV